MLLTNAYDPDPRVRQEAVALISMGCHVRLLAWDRDGKAPGREYRDGVEIERIFVRSTHGRGNTQIFFYAWLYLRFLWRGLSIAFDVVHCHDLDTLPIGVVLGFLKRRRVVYDAHESFSDMLEGSVHPALQRCLVRLENVLIRRADLLMTVGEKLRRHFVERGAERTVVVGNWKQLGEYARTAAQNRALRERLRIPETALVVVCITQLLGDRKIEALLRAADECPAVYVILGGKGRLENLVKAWANKNPRIVFVGVVPPDEIAAYTCASDVVYYGFDPENPNARFSAPNKLYEALAAGRPLIAGSFGEIADVVRSAGCGILVTAYTDEEVRNAIQRLADPALRAEMAANAKNFGERFASWRRGQEVLYEEYSRLLRGGLKPPAEAPGAGMEFQEARTAES